jgi:acetyltransferase
MAVPAIKGPDAELLLSQLFPGSSVANPIDFLATGNAAQLELIIDYVENCFSEIDGIAVIFGTPGLTKVHEVYKVIHEKMKTCRKPIFPILPSILTAHDEIIDFTSKGRVFFPDEVRFGSALSRVFHCPKPSYTETAVNAVDKEKIRKIIGNAEDGYLNPSEIQELMDATGIPRAREVVVSTLDDAAEAAGFLGFPVVMKVVGPVHKSDVGGVVLNVKDETTVRKKFEHMMKIPGTTSVLIQPMLSGIELFVGAKFEPKFGHMILCGSGGIFIEVLKDVSAALCPVGMEEALSMIRGLKSYKFIQGIRGQRGVNENIFADIIVKLSSLLHSAPEIQELDINPLLGNGDSVIAVDARIRIRKN